MDWFLYDWDLRHERINSIFEVQEIDQKNWSKV